MKYIIGDIGNTLTKICLIDNNFKISKEFSIESKKLLKKNNVIKFLKPILKQTINKKIIFSSVVPNVYRIISNVIKHKNYYCYEILLNDCNLF